MIPSRTNGPRTNQFDAPTSFITSISRRLAKIESRIVFAISIAEAMIRIRPAKRKLPLITRAAFRTRLAVFSPYVAFSTPAGGGVNVWAIAPVYSPLTGVTVKEFGSGFEIKLSTIAGCCFFMISSASLFETN